MYIHNYIIPPSPLSLSFFLFRFKTKQQHLILLSLFLLHINSLCITTRTASSEGRAQVSASKKYAEVNDRLLAQLIWNKYLTTRKNTNQQNERKGRKIKVNEPSKCTERAVEIKIQ